MTHTTSDLTNLELRIERETQVAASLAVTFDALLEQVGPAMARPDGVALPLELEPFPGGRWFRDLGNGDGHFWGHVQAIRRPTLLEFRGPLFMSSPTTNNLQYRLEETESGTTLRLVHTALGPIPEAMRDGMESTWDAQLERIRQMAATNQTA